MKLLVHPDHPATGTGDDVDPLEVVAAERRAHADDRPWVLANMVTSIDGAATVEGRSGELGGEGDRLVFTALRAEADVILAGAETVRAEGYHLPRAPRPVLAAGRARRGQADRPRLCIVTRGADLGAHPPLLDEMPDAGDAAEPWQRPIVATIGRSAPAWDDRFEVIDAGTDHVDLAGLVVELGRRGHRRILCEGGPSLLAQLAAVDCVDEWDFTLAAVAVAGTSIRALHSPLPIETTLHLDRLLMDADSNLFARYLTAGR